MCNILQSRLSCIVALVSITMTFVFNQVSNITTRMPVFTISGTKEKNWASELLPKEKSSSQDSPPKAPDEGRNSNSSKMRYIPLLLYITGGVTFIIFFLCIVKECGRIYHEHLLAKRNVCLRNMSYSCSGLIPFDPLKIPFIEEELYYVKIMGGINPSSMQYFELDLVTEKYMMIRAMYKNKRSALFIHDFQYNTTTIVDLNHEKCFTMPLNRSLILKPRKLTKMIQGKISRQNSSKVTTVRVRGFMVPLGYRRDISCHVIQQCAGRPIYRVVDYKRLTARILPEEAKFAEFAGNGMISYEIMNYQAISNVEKMDLD